MSSNSAPGFLLRPGVISALGFALSGAVFIAASVLLARRLPPTDYGLLSLLISLTFLGGRVAPLGMDGVINRRIANVYQHMAARILPGAGVVGIGFAAIAAAVYNVDVALCAALALAILAQGIVVSVAAHFQARQNFIRSLTYLRSADLLLIIPAVCAMVLVPLDAATAYFIWTALLVSTAAIALLLKAAKAPTDRPAGALGWKEGVAYLGVQLSADVLVQLERLLTPFLLDLQAMATLSIALAIIGPPFRLLQLTTGYALQPMLRAAPDSPTRRRLIRSDALRAGAITAAACLLLAVLTPALVDLLLGHKYKVEPSLMIALLASGALKVASGFAKAGVTALATNRQLAYMAVAGWTGVLLGIAAAVAGSGIGLAALVWGVSAGWAFRVIVGLFVIRQRLRDPK